MEIEEEIQRREKAMAALSRMKDMEKEKETPYEITDGKRVVKCSTKEKMERYKKLLNIK